MPIMRFDVESKRGVMMKYLAATIVLMFLMTMVSVGLSREESGMENNPEKAIKELIEKSYIRGIHGNQDESLVRSGFHEDFAMLVLSDNDVVKVNVGEWLERLKRMKSDNPELWHAKTHHDFVLIDVTDSSAVAKLNVFKGQTHFSTDYMLLYKFEEGWRIVSKIFEIPQS
jgi:hypothetical protein